MNEKNVSQIARDNESLRAALKISAHALLQTQKEYEAASALQKSLEKKASEDSAAILRQIEELKEKVKAIHGAEEDQHRVVMKKSAEHSLKRGDFNLAMVMDAMFRCDPLDCRAAKMPERIKTLKDYLDLGYCCHTEDEKVREIKTKWDDTRKGWKAFAFTADDINIYLAFDDRGVLVSALRVEKGHHAGDTTYTKAYGCQVNIPSLNELYKRADSREGISFTQWMDQRVTLMSGITDKELTERHLEPEFEGSNYTWRENTKSERASMLGSLFSNRI